MKLIGWIIGRPQWVAIKWRTWRLQRKEAKIAAAGSEAFWRNAARCAPKPYIHRLRAKMEASKNR